MLRLFRCSAVTVAWAALLAGVPLLAQAAAAGPGPLVHPDRLLVKLRDESAAALRDGRLVAGGGADLGAVAAHFARAARAEPLFTALPPAELDRWHQRACSVLPPEHRPGHLGRWFRLVARDAGHAAELAAALAGESWVEHCLPEAIPVPAGAVANDLPPPTPSFAALQLSHGPAPAGHDVRRTAAVFGARGQGVAVRMVEESWVLDHEDVPALVATSFLGPVPWSTGQSMHGLAGASILSAGRNGYGMDGIADRMDLRFCSHLTNGGVDNALLAAAAACQPGDVVLLVMMFLLGQLGVDDWVPYEFLQPTYDAVRTITANGRIVVAAGGNGANNLDDPRFLRRFDRGFRDSGAILVGATAAGQLARATFSNYGSRIDANSWGDQVVVAGYGTLFFPNQDVRQAYTGSGTGTSSATPHIGGLVAAMQGAARRQLGRALTVAEIQQALHLHGTPMPEAIGLRPDLAAIYRALGILDGLEMAAPTVDLGSTATVAMSGPNGSLSFLFAALGAADVPVGFNRNLHLDSASLLTVGFFPLPAGTASYTLPVPNDPALRGADLYFQAARLQGAAPLHVTNSCQVTIL